MDFIYIPWYYKLLFWKTPHYKITLKYGCKSYSIKKPRYSKNYLKVVTLNPNTLRYSEDYITCTLNEILSIEIVYI